MSSIPPNSFNRYRDHYQNRLRPPANRPALSIRIPPRESDEETLIGSPPPRAPTTPERMESRQRWLGEQLRAARDYLFNALYVLKELLLSP